jgi:aminoglycoside phosphotransferase (APT) family kinase protein
MRPSEELVRAVTSLIEELFGEAPAELTAIFHGETNRTFRVALPGRGRLIVRLRATRSAESVYHKESWAMGLAREAGLPVARVLHVGYSPILYSYSIHEYLSGQNGADYRGDPGPVWEQLGQLAARINVIRTDRFWISPLDEVDSNRAPLWGEFIGRQIGARVDWGLLCDRGFIHARDVPRCVRRLEEMKPWCDPPSLAHGDLQLKNILLDADGRIVAILDWSNAVSIVARYYEIATAFLAAPAEFHGPFLRGYGVGDDENQALRRHVETMQLCRLLGMSTWLARADHEVVRGIDIPRERAGLAERLRHLIDRT